MRVLYVALLLTAQFVLASSQTCPPCSGSNTFQCNDCSCISSTFRCDRDRDCLDSSDEINCNYTRCSEYTCKNSQCITSNLVCDGADDCGDGSDELRCDNYYCNPQEWACPSNGRCIKISQVCDNNNDCALRGDEGATCSSQYCGTLACDHACRPTPTGGKCYCRDGYQIDTKDNRTCIAFDKCSHWGSWSCDQKCRNGVGAITCSCRPPYTLSGTTNCVAPNSNDMRLLASLKTSIFKIDVNGNSNQPVVSSISDAVDIDYHLTKGLVLWTDNKLNKVMMANQDGTNIRELPVKSLLSPVSLTVDWIGDNIYIAEQSGRRIDLVMVSGLHQRHVISDGLYDVRVVRVDPTVGYLFYVDLGRRSLNISGSINRAYMDGSKRVAIVKTKIVGVYGLTLDYVNQRIYWSDSRLDHIEVADYNGQNRRVILHGSNKLPQPRSITVFQNMVFWADTTKMAANVFQGISSIKEIYKYNNPNVLSGIVARHSARQPTVRNPCSANKCQHMCVITRTTENDGLGFRCMCTTGYKLATDLISCTKITKFILFASQFSIRGIPLGGVMPYEVDAMTPVTDVNTNFVGIDYDASQNLVYYSDTKNDFIHVIKTDGSGGKSLVGNGLSSVEGLALDWVSKVLYYTDNGPGTITAMKVSKPADKRAILKNLGNPRAIVIDPNVGYLFWTEWLRQGQYYPRIGRSWGSGENKTDLVTGDIVWPNGLAIDYLGSKIFWVDAYYDWIGFCGYDGTSRGKLTGHSITHPFGIVVHKDYAYFTDWRLKAILKVKKDGSGNAQFIRGNLERLMGISVFDSDDQTIKTAHPCLRQNGGCSDFCFAVNKLNTLQRHCGCPYGKKMSSNLRTCEANPTEPPVPLCQNGYFRCNNSRCIDNAWKCDGDDDCRDNSDEQNCPVVTCKPGEFTCTNGRCIREAWKCDGDNDCRDSSDEISCPGRACLSNQFKCASNLCIPSQFVCDTDNDCKDGSDERNCSAKTCATNQYTCTNGRCLVLSLVCDGFSHCPDGADERNCPVRNCTSGQFTCNNRHCIPSAYRCDGAKDCSDNSDESNCPTKPPNCHPTEFQCATSGTCIPATWKCDGKADCIGGTDEPPTCPVPTCAPNTFKCDNGRCIPNSWLCDYEKDCSDGSDEDARHSCPPKPFKCPFGQWECPGGKRICINNTNICDGKPHCPGGHDEGAECNSDSCSNSNGGCSHFCRQTPFGVACFCTRGDVLNGTKTCVDKNECETPGACSQKCINTKGSFKCECATGYTLLDDKTTCKSNNSELAYLIVSNQVSLIKSSLDVWTTGTLRIPEVGYITSVDWDGKTDRIYWADTGLNKIFSAFSNVTDIKVLFSSGIDVIENLVVDWIGRNLYWVDYSLDAIIVAPLSGQYRTVVIGTNLTNPRGLAVDPAADARYLFWSDWGQKPKIERSGMDGSGRMTIVSDKLYWPNGITIDYPNKRLYYADAYLDTVSFVNYDGTGRTVIIKSDHFVVHPHGIAVFEDVVYWTDTVGINRCNKFRCDDKKVLVRQLNRPRGITIHHPNKQRDAPNPCANSTCSHICLLSPTSANGYTCACPTGMALVGNKCVAGQRDFMMVMKSNSLAGIYMDKLDGGYDAFVPVAGLPNVLKSFDYDSEKGTIYWSQYTSTTQNGTVRRIQFDGSNLTSFLPNGLGSAYSLSLDYVSRNIYVANIADSTIEVIQLDSEENYRTVVLSNSGPTGVFRPADLVVDPTTSKLYWLDIGGSGSVPMKVASANLDGSNATILVQDNLQHLDAVTVDTDQQILYWCDGSKNVIEQYNLTSGARSTFLSEGIRHPRGLTYYKNRIYVYDTVYETITGINVNNASDRTVIQRNIALGGDIHVFTQRHKKGLSNACTTTPNGGCSQLCLPNSKSTRVCACTIGSVKDGETGCKAHTSFIVVSQLSKIRGFAIDGEHEEAMVPVTGAGRNALHISSDIKNGNLYWTDWNRANSSASGIYTIKPDGTGMMGIVTRGIGLNGVRGLAVDWLTGLMYFTNALRYETFLEVVRLDGSQRLVLKRFSKEHPRAIAVNPFKRYMYWLDYSQNPKLVRANLDGSDAKTVVTNGIRFPRGICVDITTHYVYWVDSLTDTVQRVTFSGGSRQTVRSVGWLPNMYAVTVFLNDMYVVDRNFAEILKTSKEPSTSYARTVIRKNLPTLRDILVFDNRTQPGLAAGETHPCLPNNGGCEQLCFAMPNSTVPQCNCSTGELEANGKNCTDIKEYLVFMMDTEIRSVHLDPNNTAVPWAPITGLNGAVAFDFDYKNQMMYFSQVRGRRLSKVSLTGKDRTVEDVVVHLNRTGLPTGFAHLIISPDGVAFDWIAKKIYWSDYTLHRITSMNIDKSHRITLIRSPNPRAIVLDPCRGNLYFSDWGRRPFIAQTTMGGNSRKNIVTTGLGWPNGLTIDYAEDKIYWADALFDYIARADLDGNHRETIVSTALHPFAITVYGHFLYWTDWTLNGVYRAEKHTGANIVTVVPDLPRRPYDIHVYTGGRQTCTTSPCDNHNGGCSHSCHPAPNGQVECKCPDYRNMKLANGGKTCVPTTSTCSSTQFSCGNGNCRPQTWQCDLDDDCGDGSDENPNFCALATCDAHKFVCGNGRCVPLQWRCDFDDDCRDNTDEQSCVFPTCAPGEFQCKNFRCIDAAQRCDGIDHCRDGNRTDELNCPPRTCGPGQAICNATNICISRRWLCDGDNDCGDRSDEDPLFCAATTCAAGDFRCSNHRCLPASWHCDGDEDCPDGLDEPTAYCNLANKTCFGNQFTCDNGKCVSDAWICDGDNDCEDNSDEDSRHNCLQRTCAPDQFLCLSNRNQQRGRACIPRNDLCDGTRDCLEGEDEAHSCPPRTCPAGRFQCANGVCIPQSWACDRDNDCGDSSDEPSNCTYPTCGPEDYKCDDGRCIRKAWACDGDNDCRDRSDEKASLCLTEAPTCPGGQFRCNNGGCINHQYVCNKNNDCADGSDEQHCGVDECAGVIARCEQKCINTVTSFYCACNPGYTLMSDRRACRDINECTERPGSCSQLCSNTVGSFLCKCSTDYLLEPDGKSCKRKSTVQPYLMFSNRYYMRNLSVDGKYYSLLSQGHSNVIAFDFDIQENKVYLIDVGKRVIQRMFVNGTGLETIIKHGVPAGEGLAVDWIGRKIYWVDYFLEKMFVAELNGTFVKTVVSTNIGNPRAVVVDPHMGYVFWTDWGVDAYIGRVGMDGSNRKNIVTTKVGWPNALTIDYITKTIWWADAHLDYIDHADYDGKNRHQVLSGTVPHVFAMTVFEDYIYWTDWNHKSIEKANRFTGGNRTYLRNGTIHRPFDIHIHHPLTQKTGPKPCGNNNGGCSHLCLTAFGGQNYTCACPDFFLLAPDNKTCIANCTNTQFRCGGSDDRCIPILWKCDGGQDCKDGSDEPQDCPVRHCPVGKFQCDNLNCTFNFEICDGEDNCGDNSDEKDCDKRECDSNSFKCANGKCIPKAWTCDGEEDCGDNSEESPANAQCAVKTCLSSEFTCSNNRCIPRLWKCDVDDDCGDNSDEDGCVEKACPYSWFNCTTNYRCIPSYGLCDGRDDCRDGSDEHTQNCPECHPTGDFACANKRCIPLRWRCDFEDDCGDNSDEETAICSLNYRKCSESEYRCTNNKCIPNRWRCDHDNDCGDNSDEDANVCKHQFSCMPDQFTCRSGHCVSNSSICDGTRDCRDLSDEESCPTRYPNGRYCPANQFQCDNRVCLSREWRCDGDDDCGDESDETSKVCGEITCDETTHFRCNNYKCIPRWRLCDKIDNCGDGSDENDHSICAPKNRECLIEEIKCSNQKCISADKLCNKNDDCGDQSDENGCHKNNGMNCTTRNGGCEQNCTALSAGGYFCSCFNGYKISPRDMKSCLDVNECTRWGNHCPQVCHNIKGDYKCTCAAGFTSTSNGQNCKAQGSPLVVFLAAGSEIRQYRPTAKTFEYSDGIVGGRKISTIDFDPSKRIVMWAETELVNNVNVPKIKRAYIPDSPTQQGHPQELPIRGIDQVGGLAFDWVAKNIYWTDSIKGTIGVAQSDGRYKKTLIRDRVARPYAIAVNPGLGWMYWTDIGAAPKIESAWMNGENRTLLVNSRLGHPTGITIDYHMGNRVFWSDSKLNVIESMNYDGSDRVLVVSRGLFHPFSIDVFEDKMYWVSQLEGKLYQMDKFGRGVNVTVQTGLVLPSSIKIFQQQHYDISIKNRCDKTNCWPLCLLTPGGAKCACPDGSEFRRDDPTKCDAVEEVPPTMSPLCPDQPCKNNGTCKVGADGQTKSCSCPPEYSGTYCSYKDTPKITPGKLTQDSTNLVSIVVPIVVIFIVLFVILVVIVIVRRRKGAKSLQSGGKGEFRLGDAPGVVQFREGQTVEIGTPDFMYDQQPTGNGMSEYIVDSEKPTEGFSNPMYDTVGDQDKKPPPPSGDDIDDEKPPPLEFHSNQTSPDLPKKTLDNDIAITSEISLPGNTGFAVKNGVAVNGGFNPTSVETDSDTQALVELDKSHSYT